MATEPRPAAASARGTAKRTAEGGPGLPSGTLVGRFRIAQRSAERGLEATYRAEEVGSQRQVNVTVVRADVARTLETAAMLRELRRVAALTHPFLLPLLDAGVADGVPWFATPLVPGETLRERLKRQRMLPVAEALRIGGQVAAALASVHEQGLLHGNLKPDYVLLTRDAAFLDHVGVATALAAARPGGRAPGTPRYMAPELSGPLGGSPSPKSDVYALGCLLYEMLAGRPPFDATDAEQLVAQHKSAVPKPLRELRSEVSDAVAQAVARALAKRAEDRWDAGPLAALLDAEASEAAMLRECGRCGALVSGKAAFCAVCGAAAPTLRLAQLPAGWRPDPLRPPDSGAAGRAAGGAPDEEDVQERLQRALGGAYELRGLLGQGGFAEVYLGWDTRMAREVAIKTLRSDLDLSEDLRRRFQLEIRTVANLHSPHIIAIFDVGGGEGLAWFVMPRVIGETLSDRMEAAPKGRMAIPEACRILREAAAALDLAHRLGIVHRDVKPSNIMLEGPQLNTIIMDFGIARTAESELLKLTATGVFVGSPYYMSPEQAGAEPDIDARSDQYSLAAMAYEMLAGRRPYQVEGLGMLRARLLGEPFPGVRELRPEVPERVALAIERAMASRRDDRFPSIAEFGAELLPETPSRSSGA